MGWDEIGNRTCNMMCGDQKGSVAEMNIGFIRMDGTGMKDQQE